MRGNKVLRAIGLVGILLLLLSPAISHGQGGGTVTIQLGPNSGQSIGVLSEIPEGWSSDSSTEVLPFGNYIGPISGHDIQTRSYLRFPLSAIP